jgi:hypothetical protein
VYKQWNKINLRGIAVDGEIMEIFMNVDDKYSTTDDTREGGKDDCILKTEAILNKWIEICTVMVLINFRPSVLHPHIHLHASICPSVDILISFLLKYFDTVI